MNQNFENITHSNPINNHKKIILFLSGIIFLLLIIIVIQAYLLFVKNSSSKIEYLGSVIPSINISPTIVPAPDYSSPPITYAEYPDTRQKIKPSTKNEILWRTLNYTDQQKRIAFSIKFPDVGPNCEGCFDGWPYNNSEINGAWIVGHNFMNGLNRLWELKYGALLNNVSTSNPGGNYLNETLPVMVNTITPLSINESVKTINEYDQNIIITRTESKAVNNNIFSIYKTDSDKPEYYALLNGNNHTIILFYTYNDPVYDVFDQILESFSFSLYPNPDSGETKESYNQRGPFVYPTPNISPPFMPPASSNTGY